MFGFSGFGVEDVRQLVSALPALTLLECKVYVFARGEERVDPCAEALSLLRCEPPFRALVLHSLDLHCDRNTPLESWRAVCAACASLEELKVHEALLDAAAMAALVAAALTRRLKRVDA